MGPPQKTEGKGQSEMKGFVKVACLIGLSVVVLVRVFFLVPVIRGQMDKHHSVKMIRHT